MEKQQCCVARILVTEEIADAGLEGLRRAGHTVDIQLGLTPEQLVAVIPGAHALIIRSATFVTAELLDAATDLVVVGRAGIGLDNVDVPAATRKGVMVCNAPQSNVVSAAEQAIALLMAQARNIPQAHRALVEGRWERSKWEGVELFEKTLGIVGIGRVGKLVAHRMLAFGMRVVAYDPFVTADRARQMGVELMTLEALMACSDFVSVHLPKTKETVGLLGKEMFSQAKPGQRIINTARGGIVDEDALVWAIENGYIAGAALDVFNVEPTTSSPLFSLPSVVVTPHLGASTKEAQDKAGDTIAEQIQLALAGDFVPFAVNIDASELAETVKPYLGLAEHLGRIFTGLCGGIPSGVSIAYAGELADYDTRILTLATLKGLLGPVVSDSVTYVNAPQFAAERGLTVSETKTSEAQDFVNLITIRSAEHSLAGVLFGRRGEARLVMVDEHDLFIPPSQFMLVVRNDDRPGMVGTVGTALGNAGYNIENHMTGKSRQAGTALMIICTARPVEPAIVDQLRHTPGIVSVHVIDCETCR